MKRKWFQEGGFIYPIYGHLSSAIQCTKIKFSLMSNMNKQCVYNQQILCSLARYSICIFPNIKVKYELSILDFENDELFLLLYLPTEFFDKKIEKRRRKISVTNFKRAISPMICLFLLNFEIRLINTQSMFITKARYFVLNRYTY